MIVMCPNAMKSELRISLETQRNTETMDWWPTEATLTEW